MPLPKGYNEGRWGQAKYCGTNNKCLMPISDGHLFCQICRKQPAFGQPCNRSNTCNICRQYDAQHWDQIEAWYTRWTFEGNHDPPQGVVEGNAAPTSLGSGQYKKKVVAGLCGKA